MRLPASRLVGEEGLVHLAGVLCLLLGLGAGLVLVALPAWSQTGPGTVPVILEQPRDQTVLWGAQTEFRITATGAPPLSYQWFQDQVELPGATNALYTIARATFAEQGRYSARVRNLEGEVLSASGSGALRVAVPYRGLALVGSSWLGRNALAVAVLGDYAYVADMWEGLLVFDVSDPRNPRRVGSYRTSGEAHAVAAAGNYVYVADYGAGLQVIDVSDPANPRRVGAYDTPGLAVGVAVAGSYAYVADYSAGLQVIDVSDPTKPKRVGGAAGFASGVAVSGGYAYVVAEGSGLCVVDVRNPATPRLQGSYDTAGVANGVAVAGDYAYVADGPAGLQVISIGNPASPKWVGGLDTSGDACAVAIAGSYA